MTYSTFCRAIEFRAVHPHSFLQRGSGLAIVDAAKVDPSDLIQEFFLDFAAVSLFSVATDVHNVSSTDVDDKMAVAAVS
jgi:hypothetical protein